MNRITFDNPIAETLLISLYGRAVEQEILSDSIAKALVDTLPADFDRFANRCSSLVGSAICARFFDDVAKDFIRQRHNPIIVNVGVGLDTRTQRLGKLASSVPCYGVDLPEVMAIRERVLPALPNERFFASSLLEVAWLDTLQSRHPDGDFLFIIEGVLMYLDEAQNRQFFGQVAERFDGAMLYFDMASNTACKNSRKHPTVGKTNAQSHFGLDDVKVISHWHDKLHYHCHHYFGEFSKTRKMGLGVWLLMKVVPMFQKSFVLLAYRVS